MARVWVIYREGLRPFGHVVATVPLENAARRIDIAPWRFFTAEAPEEVSADRVHREGSRKRVLLEVLPEDRGDFCNLNPGFYESPYSPEEVVRRLELDVA